MALATPTVQFDTLYYHEDKVSRTIPVGSSAWFEWLSSATTFAFTGKSGTFTARKEQAGNQRGGWYWRAYRKRAGKLHRAYLGKNEELTLERLNATAEELVRRSALSEEAELTSTPVSSPSNHTRAVQPKIEALLATKLYKPVPPVALVTRPRLVERLRQANYKLALISAPPGFGKTTLLAEWLNPPKSENSATASTTSVQNNSVYPPSTIHYSPSPLVVWFSLDEGDNDPARFWTYFIQGLGQYQAGFGQSLLKLLQASQLPRVEQLLAGLINELAGLSQHFIIVLDDYHLIETSAIHRGISFLLEHLPPNLRLVITSRTDPPLPLGRMRVRGELLEIRANDLRFSESEAADFLAQVMGLRLSVEEIAVLEERTEGWVAGLQLAALALKLETATSSQFVQAFRGSHRYLLDYLTEEVLQRQPPEIQNFLLQTSILDRLTASLVEAITGCDDGQALLERLEQSNLFLIPLDNERGWYRYHHLFQEYLQKRLNQQQPEHVPILQKWAAQWFSQHGMETEAVDLALDARDFEMAADLIEQAAPASLLRGETTTLRRWLEVLPESMQQHPKLSLLLAWVQALEGQPEAAEKLLEAALNNCGPSQSQLAGDTEIETLRSLIALQNLDLERIQLVGQTLDNLPEGSPFLTNFKLLLRALALDVSGNTEAALEAYRQVCTLSRNSGNVMIRLIGLSQWADQLALLGKLHQAADLHREALTLLHDNPATPTPLWFSATYMGLANLLYEWNELEEARLKYEAALRLASQFENGLLLSFVYSSLAKFEAALGNMEGAYVCLSQSEQASVKYGTDILKIFLDAIRVRINLKQGKLVEALRWVATYEAGSPSTNTVLLELQTTTLAKVYLTTGQADRALTILEDTLEQTRATGHITSLIQLLALQAQAFQAQGNLAQAHSSLAEALALAEPEGYVRSFLDEGEALATLLASLAHNPDQNFKFSTAYLQKLLAAFGQTAQLPPNHTLPSQPASILTNFPSEQLTERELAVLRLLVNTSLSNPEIANELVVAVSTVRTHIKSIYSKLGVQNRLQAAERARSLHLVK